MVENEPRCCKFAPNIHGALVGTFNSAAGGIGFRDGKYYARMQVAGSPEDVASAWDVGTLTVENIYGLCGWVGGWGLLGRGYANVG